MESDIIKISHLTKNFGDVKAVNDLNFKVIRGELFAFLGINGAGKSTTICDDDPSGTILCICNGSVWFIYGSDKACAYLDK